MKEIKRTQDSFCDTKCPPLRGYKDEVELERGEIFGIDLNSFSVYVPYVEYDSKGNLCYKFTNEILEKSKTEKGIPLLMQYIDKNRAKEITTGRIFYIGRTLSDALSLFGMYDKEGNFNSNMTIEEYIMLYRKLKEDPLCIILNYNANLRTYLEINDCFKAYYDKNFDYLEFQNILFESEEETKAHYKAATTIMSDKVYGVASTDAVILKYTKGKKQ